MTAEFDKYAKDYEALLANSVKASGYNPSYFDEQKVSEVFRVTKPQTNTSLNFLNFGCGVGKSEQYIRKYFPSASMHAADVSVESLKIAKERNKDIDNLTFHHFETIENFNPGAKFDIIMAANVFHHIPEKLHVQTLQHLRKLLTSNGKLFVFEHNPINPLTRKSFASCEFDQGCKMIPSGKLETLARDAGFKNIKTAYTLFFPKFLQRLIFLEPYLKSIPVGAQYYIQANC